MTERFGCAANQLAWDSTRIPRTLRGIANTNFPMQFSEFSTAFDVYRRFDSPSRLCLLLLHLRNHAFSHGYAMW